MVALPTLILSENTEQLSSPTVNMKYMHKVNLCPLKSLELQLQPWRGEGGGTILANTSFFPCSWLLDRGKQKRPENFPVPLEFIAMESDFFFFFATSWINSYVGIKIMAFEYPTSGHTEFFQLALVEVLALSPRTQAFSIGTKVSCYLLSKAIKPQNSTGYEKTNVFLAQPSVSFQGYRFTSNCQGNISETCL